MKLQLDACISRAVFEACTLSGHDVERIVLIDQCMPDELVAQLAFDQGQVLITLDRGLVQFIRRRRLSIGVVHFSNMTPRQQAESIADVLAENEDALVNCSLVLVRPTKVRVRYLDA